MSYIGNTPGVSSQRIVLEEVISGSPKSVFTPISGYIKGYVDVLINGHELDTNDFTANDGVTVTLVEAAAVGDTVKVKTWLPRGLSDGYLKTEADARFAALGSSYTKSEADAKYALIAASYTKSEADAKYALLAAAYTKSEADARFLNLAGGQLTGPVGLGQTLSAWGSGINPLQLKGGSLYSSATGNMVMGQNFYSDGVNSKYLTANPATYYAQSGGVHQFAYAASGSAGANITWIEAARFDANGSFVLNAISPPFGERLYVYTNTSNNAIGARLGASANNCTALLATAEAGASGDLIGAWNSASNQFRVNTAGLMMFNSGFGTSAAAYGCRAWINFNGQTTSILGSGNISSLTRVNTGCFDINMSSAMPDSNYSIGGSVQNGSFGIAMIMGLENYDYGRIKSTTGIRIYTRHDGYIRVDSPDVSVNIFR